MLVKHFSTALALCLCIPAAAHAQSQTWDTTDWVAICDPGEHQPLTTRVVYGPEPGVYCQFRDFRFVDDPDTPRVVDIRMEDVRHILDAAAFTSEIYQDWSLLPPDVDSASRPSDAPAAPEMADYGLVLRLTPELSDPDDPDSEEAGAFSSRAVLGVADAPGTLRVALSDAPTDLPELVHTLAHEMFHAIHFSYAETLDQPEALWEEDWLAEGMADAMAGTVIALYLGPGSSVPSGTATTAPLTGWARLSTDRYTGFQGGLFTTQANAVYDTSSFWAHLFTRQINDMRSVDSMLRAQETSPPSAPYIVEGWLDDDFALSLPRVYRAFLQDMIRDGSFYDGELEEALIDCTDHTVTLANDGGVRLYRHIRGTGSEDVSGMRAVCVDYNVDASDGTVTMTLQPTHNDLAPGAHLQLFTGEAVLSEGDAVTIAAGTTQTIRTIAFLSPLSNLSPPEDLIRRAFAVRFEQTPQTPCNGQTVALNGISNAWAALDQGASQAGSLPDYGEATIQARFGERVINGPACARMVLVDYDDPRGPALTFQLTHNPSSSYWAQGTGNWANINIHIPPGEFDRADLATGREIVFTRGPIVNGEAAPLVTSWDAYGRAAGHTFISEFANGWGPDTYGTRGHLQNDAISLTFTDVGQNSARGTFAFRTLGPSSAEFNDVFVTSTATGTFTVPIHRMGPRRNLDTWGNECQAALQEGRVFDMALCARAMPDGRGNGVLTLFELHWEWYYAQFMQ